MLELEKEAFKMAAGGERAASDRSTPGISPTLPGPL